MKHALVVCISVLVGCFGEPLVGEPQDDTSTSGGSDEGTASASSTATSPSGVSVGTAATTSTSSADATSEGSESVGSTGSQEDDSSGVESSSTGGPSAGQIVFVNFDGATIASGALDDAASDVAALDNTEGTYAPYGDADEADEVMDLVRSQWSEFDIAFTAVRPDDGDYTMIVVSPSDPHQLFALANADADCGNANPNNIGFTYLGAGEYGVNVVANMISWATARGFGLEPVADLSDITHIGTEPQLRSVVDACFDLSSAGVACPGSHEVFCPAGFQNSYEELELVLGLAR